MGGTLNRGIIPDDQIRVLGLGHNLKGNAIVGVLSAWALPIRGCGPHGWCEISVRGGLVPDRDLERWFAPGICLACLDNAVGVSRGGGSVGDCRGGGNGCFCAKFSERLCLCGIYGGCGRGGGVDGPVRHE